MRKLHKPIDHFFEFSYTPVTATFKEVVMFAKQIRHFAVIGVCALWAAGSGLAQYTTTSLSGTVVDRPVPLSPAQQSP
jgi:hypothetical protein